MNTKSLKHVALATLTTTALSMGLTNAAAIVVVNPGFEDPGSNTYNTADQWTTVTGWSGITGQTYAGSGATDERERTGSYGGKVTYFFDRPDGGVFQLTGHTIVAGQEFTLTFYHDSTFADALINYSLIYGDTTQIISTGTHTAGDAAGFDVVTLTGTATAAMAGQSLGILFDTNATAGFSVIDDVSLSFEAVPEPSSTALLGLAGLATLLRRRRVNA